MALTDTKGQKNHRRVAPRALAAKTAWWSDKQKIEACQTYLVLGNMAMTSRILGIPEVTLRVWKQSVWWKELVEDIKVQERIELSVRMKKLVDAAHTVVANRLETGDPVLNQKTGEIIMKPVSMKDAHKVAVDMLNQREMVEKATKPVDEIKIEDEDKLKQLAEKFAEFATKKVEAIVDERRTIDVPFVEEIKREETQMAQDDSLSDTILSDDSGTTDSMGEEEQNSFRAV